MGSIVECLVLLRYTRRQWRNPVPHSSSLNLTLLLSLAVSAVKYAWAIPRNGTANARHAARGHLVPEDARNGVRRICWKAENAVASWGS